MLHPRLSVILIYNNRYLELYSKIEISLFARAKLSCAYDLGFAKAEKKKVFRSLFYAQFLGYFYQNEDYEGNDDEGYQCK